MKNLLVSSIVLLVAAGCHGGAQTRTPEQWRADVAKEIDARLPKLRACYAVEPGAAVALRITAWPTDVKGPYDITSKTLWVEHDWEHGGQNDPPTLTDCIDRALKGLPLPPQDANVGNGTWRITFKPTA